MLGGGLTKRRPSGASTSSALVRSALRVSLVASLALDDVSVAHSSSRAWLVLAAFASSGDGRLFRLLASPPPALDSRDRNSCDQALLRAVCSGSLPSRPNISALASVAVLARARLTDPRRGPVMLRVKLALRLRGRVRCSFVL